VPGGRHDVDERPAEAGTALLEQVDGILDRFLVLDGQAVPPLDELVCDLDVPHPRTIPYGAYALKSIGLGSTPGRGISYLL
jgi:hypothetical protein